jgi:hypothetical protein
MLKPFIWKTRMGNTVDRPRYEWKDDIKIDVT